MLCTDLFGGAFSFFFFSFFLLVSTGLIVVSFFLMDLLFLINEMSVLGKLDLLCLVFSCMLGGVTIIYFVCLREQQFFLTRFT